MKTALITATLVVVLFVAVKYTANQTQGTEASDNTVVSALTSSNSSIDIEKNNLDLGDIPIKGGKVDAEFSFQNTGDEPIFLVRGGTSCMCTEAVVEKSNGDVSPRIKMPGHGSSGSINMTIDPGEKVMLVATFDPMAHGPNGIGPIRRDVTLTTNSDTSPEVKFSFQGNVVR